MNHFDSYRATHGRARGFLDNWHPQKKTLALIGQVQAVLDEYREHLPLTCRQIYYRLIGAHDYPKTANDYENLCGHLVNARRAGVIPFASIRDDGFVRAGTQTYHDDRDFIAACRNTAQQQFRLDRQAGQDERLVVWCETSGMVPQLERVCDPYGIDVLSSGGYDSVSVKHAIAEEFAGYGMPVRVLHVGDHDPSGVHLYLSLEEDISAFGERYGGQVEFERVAVLPEHIEQFGLVTSPPKASDRRQFEGETVQAEALPPDVLAELLRQAVKLHFDPVTFRLVIEEEEALREQIQQTFTRL